MLIDKRGSIKLAIAIDFYKDIASFNFNWSAIEKYFKIGINFVVPLFPCYSKAFSVDSVSRLGILVM